MAGIIPLERRLVGIVDVFAESDQGDLAESGMGLHKGADFCHRDAGRFGNRVTVDAAADRRERDSLGAQFDRQGERIPVARGELLGLPLLSTPPNGATRVDHPSGG